MGTGKFMTHGQKVNHFESLKEPTVDNFNKVFTGSKIYYANANDFVEILDLVNDGDYIMRNIRVNGVEKRHHFSKYRNIADERKYYVLFKDGNYLSKHPSIDSFRYMYRLNPEIAENMAKRGIRYKGMVVKVVK